MVLMQIFGLTAYTTGFYPYKPIGKSPKDIAVVRDRTLNIVIKRREALDSLVTDPLFELTLFEQ